MAHYTTEEKARIRALSENAKAAAERLLTDSSVREALLAVMVESIEAAHAISPRSWLPILEPDGRQFRVSVGIMWALCVQPEKITVLVDADMLDKDLATRLGVGTGRMANVPEVTLWDVTPGAFLELWPQIRDAHLSAVRRSAAKNPTNPNWRKAYSPGIIQYIEEATGRVLPRPAYATDSPQNETPTLFQAQPPQVEAPKMTDDTMAPIAFSERTFQLLGELHETPRSEVYLDQKTAFVDHVEKPLRFLMRQVVAQLPAAIPERMETENGLFSRILKNDFGRGGAWPYYWGALYPKGGKKSDGVQLYLSVQHDRLEYGFGFSDFDSDQRDRFQRNARRYGDALLLKLRERLAPLRLVSGPKVPFKDGQPDPESLASRPTWETIIKEPVAETLRLSVALPAAEVLQRSIAELAGDIREAFVGLFPLALLALLEDPQDALASYLDTHGAEEEAQEEYPLESLMEDTGFEKELLERWIRAIDRKRQAILYGPPGTGKTYLAERLARHLVGGADGFRELVQFHPAYAYEDFVQGIRPRLGVGGVMTYDLTRGRFLDVCQRAARCRGLCVLIIDEINRAHLARVFGELMYLLEYRNQTIELSGGGRFRIPDNLRLIGTMNTADRSIALVDHALRRRFAFLELRPEYVVLRRYHEKNGTQLNVEKLVERLRALNRAINDPHYEVGISYFMRLDLAAQLPDIWQMEIEPYLEEFFFDQREKLAEFRWEKVQEGILR